MRSSASNRTTSWRLCKRRAVSESGEARGGWERQTVGCEAEHDDREDSLRDAEAEHHGAAFEEGHCAHVVKRVGSEKKARSVVVCVAVVRRVVMSQDCEEFGR